MLEHEFNDRKELVISPGGLRLSINLPPSVAGKVRKACALLGDKRVSFVIRVLVDYGFTHLMQRMGLPLGEEDKAVSPLGERIAILEARVCRLEDGRPPDGRPPELEVGTSASDAPTPEASAPFLDLD